MKSGVHHVGFSTGGAARSSAGNMSAEEPAAAGRKQRLDGESEQLAEVSILISSNKNGFHFFTINRFN